MDFVINHTYREIRRVDQDLNTKRVGEIMESMVKTYEYWALDDDISLFVHETANDDEFAYVVDLIATYEYRISDMDSVFFLGEDQTETSDAYDAWLKTQDEYDFKSDSWNGWDEPYVTCDI